VLPSLVDRALDWTVVPGYSRIGYALRRRSWDGEAAGGLEGWTVLVTGASSGIGAATAERLARAGATVHMLVRDRDRGERARDEIAARTGSGRLALELCDVSSLASVREFAAGFTASQPELHALVNNAGVMPPERTLSPEGFELTFATNVLGPFLLTHLLLDTLRRGAPSRVVNVSSGGMYTRRLDAEDPQLVRREYEPAAFYAHTKRCEVVLTELWAQRLRGSGITFHAMHPGWADTPGVAASLPGFRRLMSPLLRNADQAADTVAWLVGAPEPAERPGLFWHDREPRPVHRLPRTRETPAERERLWEQCMRLSGLEEGRGTSEGRRRVAPPLETLG
jgi:NAD(P)-dependent dehydrogenase (short-subunit alcohol dehydrogenase family)